jgi:hypothetical protein
MPILSSNVSKDAAELYTGYDKQDVGLGLLNPSIYKTPGYDKKKIQKLMIGALSTITYAGREHDPMPLALPFFYESAYATVLSYNLHYLPVQYRQAMLKFILDGKAQRIKSNLPMMIDYTALKRAIPISQYIVRRYKVVGVNVIETHPLIEYPDVIKDIGRWSNHYKEFQKNRNA